MGNFEDQLWTELANAHGDELAGATRPPARRNRGRPLALTAGAFGVVGVATTVSLALTATTSTPAYAVTRNHDGTVSVTIHDMIGITGANAELEKLGAPIRAVTADPSCHDTGNLVHPSPQHPLFVQEANGNGPEQFTVTVRPADIPAGDTLVLAAQRGPVTMRIALVRGPAPACLSIPAFRYWSISTVEGTAYPPPPLYHPSTTATPHPTSSAGGTYYPYYPGTVVPFTPVSTVPVG